ncbi:MAG: hypothetical protein K2Q09_02760 [Phycisphaerales bacterium]|nr:hypothetical protein [Phycisphaerales bacterium]
MSQPVSPTTQSAGVSRPPVRKEGADRLQRALTGALCALLGVNLLVMAFGYYGPQSASAQVGGYTNGNPINTLPSSGLIPPPENIPSAPVSSPQMLRHVIDQQIETNARLARIEAQLAGPHAVTVTNWPANIGNPAPAAGQPAAGQPAAAK